MEYKANLRIKESRFHLICISKSDFDNACKVRFSALKQRDMHSAFSGKLNMTLSKPSIDTVNQLNVTIKTAKPTKN